MFTCKFDPNRFPNIKLPPLPFENAEYLLRITWTVSTDKRIMSFVNILWGFEVTGGVDQFEPLTVIAVNRSGYARRAGIRVNDVITRINDIYAHTLTLKEAQLLIRKSGKAVRIYVQGDDIEEDDEYTVDFWFTPPKRKIPQYNKWTGEFPWNDRKKPIYKESNCFMVPSRAEEHILERMLNRKEPFVVTESDENLIDTSEDLFAAKMKRESDQAEAQHAQQQLQQQQQQTTMMMSQMMSTTTTTTTTTMI